MNIVEFDIIWMPGGHPQVPQLVLVQLDSIFLRLKLVTCLVSLLRFWEVSVAEMIH